ncbi:FxSxx-COOH system tetratricopeptide repeat protein [Microtetraspora malaysiensis]|uniref:FxSxx-COOH system tetratricopeptide repeat protein n=1 Tax=Microtetraspora malaysiensis TaxID=161358 RepID=UPI000834A8DF|nr:FxSxx-COOH system tetratricopeptide repeat protein [Microtetraspora malaysiensis]
MVLLPAVTNIATNALPDAWQSKLWLAWPLSLLLAIPVLVVEFRARRNSSHEGSILKAAALRDADSRIWNIPPLVIGFSNRKSEFRAIGSFLMRASGRPLLLCGMGGIGKTQLALAYAARQRDQLSIGWWVQASSRASVVFSLAKLGREMGISAPNARALAEEVVQQLSERAGWLLIFDDAKRVDDLVGLVPVTAGGQVLITSRNPRFDRLAEPMLLQVFPAEEAARFLRQRVGDTDQAPSSALAEKLGGLPLALEQAAAYCRDSGIGLSDYLKRFEVSCSRLLRQGTGSGRIGLEATLDLSLARVAQVERAAAQLLRVLAFMAPTDIPRDLFSSGAKFLPRALARSAGDVLSMDRTVGALIQTSLLTSATADHVRVHPLISAMLRDTMRPRTGSRPWSRTRRILTFIRRPGRSPSDWWPASRWIRATLLSLGQGMATDDWNPESWNRASTLLPHVDALWSFAEDYRVSFNTKETALVARLFAELGVRMYRRGDYKIAEELCRRALDIARAKLPEDDLGVLYWLNYLAQVKHRKGEVDEAVRIFEKVLGVYEEKLGREHSDTLMIMNNLGGALAEREDQLVRARSLYEYLIAVRTRTVGERAPETMIAVNNLGKVYRRLGDLDAAYEISSRALRIGVEVEGEEDPGTLLRMNNLAEVLRVQGNIEESRQLHEKALGLRRKVLGGKHPDVVVSMNNLARVARLQGDREFALELYKESLALAERVAGDQHPLVAVARRGIQESAAAGQESSE